MTSRTNEAEVIAAIESAIQARDPRRAGKEIRFLCPAHDDHDPSARWNPEKRVWRCDVCGADGGYVDLAKHLDILSPSVTRGLSVAELAEAKGLPEKFLRKLGITDGVVGQERTRCVDIPYPNAAGEVAAVRKRLNLTGDNRFIWRRGDHPIPYGLAMLPAARERTNFLVIVEGESDQWVCRYADLPAVGIPGASVMKAEWGKYFEGIANVFVWCEPGMGGMTFVGKAAEAVSTVRVIVAPADAKDPAELWLRCGRDIETFVARMSELAHSAPHASSIKADTSRQEAREAKAQGDALLLDPKLLERIEEAIRRLGYAGDATPAKIAYLGLTSRLLRRPLNLAFIGPSAAGKNRAVDTAVDLMPPSAYHLEKAGSARALIYSEASFQHRTVIVAEADSIPEDGPAASAIRTLASDNEMTYDTVEKDSRGGFVVRHIVKAGPTGLITTSTRPLPHQFDTRTLTVTVRDTPDQTRDVMRAHAASVKEIVEEPDVSELIAVQRWLELGGERRVMIPYADTLAEVVPADQVRMRRDFRQLLTMIEALAVLHQCQRERDQHGRIVASLDDYEHARELLLNVFKLAASGGVTPEVRQTVQAVHRIYQSQPLTKQAVATELKLSKDTVWYRIGRALSLGYLANDEARKGHPAKLRPGDPLPDDQSVLPSALELSACVNDRPEIRSTVQPPDWSQTDSESGEPVEPLVESGVQPLLQPSLVAGSDSDLEPSSGAVERLNADPEGPSHGSPRGTPLPGIERPRSREVFAL